MGAKLEYDLRVILFYQKSPEIFPGSFFGLKFLFVIHLVFRVAPRFQKGDEIS